MIHKLAVEYAIISLVRLFNRTPFRDGNSGIEMKLIFVENFGNFEEVAILVGGATEDAIAIVKGLQGIITGDIAHFNSPGGGLDIGGIEFGELVKIIQNAAQLDGELLFFGVCQL